ncbi:MAG: lamin tail domain-containing protein [Balneolaceae bacterium]|nr:lamin tail domain-containing protein [Balneolaceae bacterium]
MTLLLRSIRYSLIFIISVITLGPALQAQQVVFEEDFEGYSSVADFINNSPWSGDLEDFTLVTENGNQLLRLNASEAGLSELSFESETAYGTWEFYYRPEVAPSNANRTHFFLISETDDFNIIGSGATSSTNGYVLRAGDNTGNRVFKLGRVVNGSLATTNIFLETNTVIEEGVGYFVRITRSENGDWQIILRNDVNDDEEITVVANDNIYTTSSHSGIAVIYSGLNTENFFFDDFIISEETDEFLAESVELTRANQLDITFNNTVDEFTVLTSNFSVDGGAGNPSSAEVLDGEDNVVRLTFSDPFGDGDFNLTINNVQDEFGQEIEPGTELPFSVTNPFDVESITAVSSTSLEVEFTEAPDEATLSTSNFTLSGGGITGSIQPDNIEYTEGEESVFLNFGTALSLGDYQLTIDDVLSEFDWPLRGDNVFDFEVENPFIVTDFNALNRTTFEITFSQDIQSGGDNTANYSIAGIGSPQIAEVPAGSPNVVIIQFADPLDEGDFELQIENITSVDSWQIDDGTAAEFALINNFELDTLDLFRGDEITLEFSDVPDEATLITSNFEISGIGNPADISYDPLADPNIVVLELNEPLFSDDYTLITTNLLSEFGWPLFGDTEFAFTVDNPFEVSDFEIVSTTEFVVTFSQNLLAGSVNTSAFVINGIGSPNNASIENDNAVRITFNDSVDEGDQELIINDIRSLEGWQIAPDTTIPFALFGDYEPGDLVVSELYYRVPISWRTSEFDRPRYLEIFNRSDKTLNLRNFTLTGQNISVDSDLPISPGEYLVLTRGVPVFEERFGERNFVEVDNFPTLNLTTSSSVVFETDEGELIEQFTYVASTWGGNEVSLERISFDVPSEFRDNWAESEDILTGSPGLPNTVSPPTDVPQAVSAAFPAPQTLRITFSRTLSESSLESLSNFSLNNNAVFTSVEFTSDERTIEFELDDTLEDQFEYTLSYQNIDDIFGNSVSGAQQFNFVFENPFRILSAGLENDTDLLVQFTLPIQTPQLVGTGSFELSDGTSPSSVSVANSETLRLSFSEPFDVGSYLIIANDITSLENGWELEENSEFEFFRFDEYQPGDIVINEFMYRPPEGYPRYVEIHNVSGRFLNLRDWELRRAEGASSNGGAFSEFDLPIEPGGFVVITPNASLLEEIFGDGPWVQMNNYPGLTQTTPDRIRLIDSEGDVVEFVDYNPSTWGGNGVALERRRTDLTPEFSENWDESPNELLGTPGQPNEVNPNFELVAETVEALSREEVRVVFNADIRESDAIPANFSVGGTNPESIVFENGNEVLLEFSSNLSRGERTLTINSVRTLGGFEIASNSQYSFFVFDPHQSGDIVINEFMYRPASGFVRYVELYNRSNRLINLRDWELRRAEGAPSNGGVFSDSDLAIQPGGYIVITPDDELLEEIYGSGPWVQMNNFPGFTQTVADQIRLINPDGDVEQFIEYVPSTWGGNGVSLERRSVSSPENNLNNWGESLAELFGTPGEVNTVEPDDKLPELIRAGFVSADTVSVEFSGSLDLDQISTGNFEISSSLNIAAVEFIDPFNALLVLSGSMNSGTTYTVTASNIPDIFGNVLSSAQAQFSYYLVEQAEPGDVVINEFMYNEPDDYTRYIELFNRSSKAVDLAGWRQANDTGTRRTITNQQTILPPNSYIVIVPNENLLSIFPDLPFVNAGGNLSALKNGGDEIVIENNLGEVMDSLRYSPTWGGNGVALERRRADRSPLFRENWAESPNELFGTPGAPNDVERDFNLTATTARATSRRAVEVVFNANIREDDLITSNFSVNGANPSEITFEETDTILLEFDNNFPIGSRTLTISNIRTLGGFQIADNSQFTFTVFDEFEDGDIVINEFMYRPPTGYVRYVELFNNSDKLLNLRNWRLQRRQISSESRRIISEDDLLLEPGDFIVITEDEERMVEIFGERNFYEISSFPNFTVTAADQIRLFTDTDLLADSLEYTPSSWGGNGVALERISADAPATLQQNWEESPNELLGTPGLPNDVTPDTQPPVLLSGVQFEDQGFRLRFNKELDSETALTASNYSISPSMSVSMVGLDGTDVILFVSGDLVNDQVYEITAQNISDIFGNVMQPTTISVRYLEFGDAQPREIVINEILYRRLQAGSPEFVEIFNRTEQNFDLTGWSLADATGSANIPAGTAIRENDYLVFTDTESFAAENERIIYLPGFRSLNNTTDAVVIRNSSGTAIDSLTYRASWYNNPAGVSLERRDPAAISIDRANWAPSTDERGSTPAEENSRFEPDETPPSVIFANIFHPDSLEVVFSEFIDLTNETGTGSNKNGMMANRLDQRNDTPNNTRFLINGSVTDLLKYDARFGNRVVLSAAGTTFGESITLTIENLGDFQGNISTEIEQPVAQPLQPGDLVFNEIMYNPLADDRDGIPDQSEYIEIYNRRSYAVSLEGIFLHDEPNENDEIVRIEPLTSSQRWLPANGYALFYPEPTARPFTESRTARFFELSDDFEPFAFQAIRTTLSLPNAGRRVYLADSTRTVIDMVDYSPDWHNPNLVDTRGISLERVNPDLETNDPSNWSSNTTIQGGSPGMQNSIFQETAVSITDTGVFLDPNPFSPDGDGFEDNLFINYKFDEPDYLLRVRIYDRYGRLVRTLAEGTAAGFEGSIIWDGLTDDGQRNRIGIYIVFVEAYNSSSGRNRAFRETAVLARQF